MSAPAAELGPVLVLVDGELETGTVVRVDEDGTIHVRLGHVPVLLGAHVAPPEPAEPVPALPPPSTTTQPSRPSSAPVAATPRSALRWEGPVTDPRRWRGPCRARCAATGRTCALPAHAEGEHAAGSYRFRVVAPPGATHFPRAAELAAAALSRPDAE